MPVFFHWLLFAAFINTAIDAPNNLADTGVNEIESIYEWFTEIVLDINDAVPELPDNKQEDDLKVQKKITDWHYTSLTIPSIILLKEKNTPILNRNASYSAFSEVSTPPPKLLS